MVSAPPPEIEITALPDGVHYRLPWRRLGAFHWVGLIPLAIGLPMVISAAAVPVWIAFWSGSFSAGPQGWLLLVTLIPGLLTLMPGLLLTLVGAALLKEQLRSE